MTTPAGGGRAVVVVLGAAVWEGGRPSHALRRRVAHGVSLALEDAARHLMVTGGVGRHGPSEARVMADLALEAGLSAERIVLEDRATSTDESARFCARLIAGRGYGRVVVVTDAYHLPRTLLAFRHAGVLAHGAATPDSPGSRGSRAQRRRERIATLLYHLRAAGRRLAP